MIDYESGKIYNKLKVGNSQINKMIRHTNKCIGQIFDIIIFSTIDGTLNILDLCTFNIINFTKTPNIISDMLIINLEILSFPKNDLKYSDNFTTQSISSNNLNNCQIKLIIASKDKLIRIYNIDEINMRLE